MASKYEKYKNTDITQKELSEIYEVDTSSISRIVNKLYYKNI